MNKADLISAVAAESGLSKADAKKAVEGVVSAVSNALKSGDKVSLVGFGTFSVVEKAERMGINPDVYKRQVISGSITAKDMIKISGTITRSDFRNQTQFVHHRLFKGHHIQTCGVGQIVQFHIEQCSSQQFGCHKSLIESILVLYLPNQFIGNHLTGLIEMCIRDRI